MRYKNRVEKYIIFTSLYQLKIAVDCDDFFLDGKFKCALKGYYQMLNLWGFIRKKNAYLPISNIILSNKSYELYEKIIKEFIHFFESFNIEIKFEDKSIMCDFEHSLTIAIKNNIKGINLRGCYFHYAKAIYKRCKSYGLFTKKKKRDTIFIAFILKLYPYIPTKLRKDYIQKIES